MDCGDINVMSVLYFPICFYVNDDYKQTKHNEMSYHDADLPRVSVLRRRLEFSH